MKLKSRWKKLVESRSRYEIGSNRKDKKKTKTNLIKLLNSSGEIGSNTKK